MRSVSVSYRYRTFYVNVYMQQASFRGLARPRPKVVNIYTILRDHEYLTNPTINLFTKHLSIYYNHLLRTYTKYNISMTHAWHTEANNISSAHDKR